MNVKQKGSKKNMCKKAITEIRKSFYESSKMPLTDEEYSQYAEEVLKECKVDYKKMDKPVAIATLANRIGFEIFQKEFEKRNVSGIIAIDARLKETVYETDMVICLNLMDTELHQRFTIAHELAHYIFDFEETKHASYYNTYITADESDVIEENDEENRANRFAAELLMPKESFQKDFDEMFKLSTSINDNITKLVDKYKTPSTSIKKRILELKLANKNYDLQKAIEESLKIRA